jgi:hypothetical protein
LRPQLRTSFHHQPEAQHPNFPLSTSEQADYPIFQGQSGLGTDWLLIRKMNGRPDRHSPN